MNVCVYMNAIDFRRYRWQLKMKCRLFPIIFMYGTLHIISHTERSQIHDNKF